MQLLKRQVQYAQIISYKIAYIIVVCFCVEKGFLISLLRFGDHPRDRKKLCQPIALLQQEPIEQSTRRPPITINKGVHIGQHKMDDNPTNDRMNKDFRLFIVEKLAQFFDKRGDFDMRWGAMHYVVRNAVFNYDIVVRTKAPRCLRIVQRMFGHQLMNVQ